MYPLRSASALRWPELQVLLFRVPSSQHIEDRETRAETSFIATNFQPVTTRKNVGLVQICGRSRRILCVLDPASERADFGYLCCYFRRYDLGS